MKQRLKEWVAMGSKKPGTEQVKDAMEAYQLAQHYLQIANRDQMFGREDKSSMKLAKQFYEQYKDLKSKGDESADDLFKNELVDNKIENFSETEMPQTSLGSPHKIRQQDSEPTESVNVAKEELDPTGSKWRKRAAVSDKRIRKSLDNIAARQERSSIRMDKSVEADRKRKHQLAMRKRNEEHAPEEVQYEALQQDSEPTHAVTFTKGAKVGARSHRTVYVTADHEDHAVKVAKKHRDYPGKEYKVSHVRSESVYEEHAPEVVEYIPHAYNYNRKSWMNALDEVNRYKGRSGHRVTKTEKEGPEHIVMQMRKVMSLGDNHQGVDFNDGTKKKVTKGTAQRFLNKYNSARPEEKIKLQKSASHSQGGLHHATSDKPIEHGPGQDKKPMFKAAVARREPLRGVQHPDDE